ncbi:MAG: hypothetical protein IKW38_05940 [Kiritimatiellae bacterium]|nr:hypothetical protein [Kiritimatiellia bacterium]
MTFVTIPYFMTNEAWYTFNFPKNGKLGCVLTDKAPQKAIKSWKALQILSEIMYDERVPGIDYDALYADLYGESECD